MKLGPKDFLAVIGTHKLPNNVTGNSHALLGVPKPRLHLVLNDGADFKNLAPFCCLGKSDDCARRATHIISVQAESVTTVSTLVRQKESSLICAKAQTFCESANRIRVLTSALPDSGVK